MCTYPIHTIKRIWFTSISTQSIHILFVFFQMYICVYIHIYIYSFTYVQTGIDYVDIDVCIVKPRYHKYDVSTCLSKLCTSLCFYTFLYVSENSLNITSSTSSTTSFQAAGKCSDITGCRPNDHSQDGGMPMQRLQQ